MHGLLLVFPPAAAAILCFPVNEIPNILHIPNIMASHHQILSCKISQGSYFILNSEAYPTTLSHGTLT
jgi:hypothetical protein